MKMTSEEGASLFTLSLDMLLAGTHIGWFMPTFIREGAFLADVD